MCGHPLVVGNHAEVLTDEARGVRDRGSACLVNGCGADTVDSRGAAHTSTSPPAAH
jgi:hypothetical protein